MRRLNLALINFLKVVWPLRIVDKSCYWSHCWQEEVTNAPEYALVAVALGS